MRRNRAKEAQIRRAAERLGRLVSEYAADTGLTLEIFGEDGSAYVLDSERDGEYTGGRSTVGRSRDWDDGGSVVIHLPTGGVTWSGGGF